MVGGDLYTQPACSHLSTRPRPLPQLHSPGLSGSVRVNTSRKRRRKVPLSGLGTIYPPFILPPEPRKADTLRGRRSEGYKSAAAVIDEAAKLPYNPPSPPSCSVTAAS